jgi:hypothetical protein
MRLIELEFEGFEEKRFGWENLTLKEKMKIAIANLVVVDHSLFVWFSAALALKILKCFKI